MHRAPWTNTSISAGQSRVMAAMSRRLSSRASTTRSRPSSAARQAPPKVCRLIWVLAWRGTSGAISRASRHTPQSWMRIASTPMSEAFCKAWAAAGSSRSVTRVFRVR